jgi:DNA topoisomerase-2
MTDADDDGIHITSLFMNLLNERFPSLLLIEDYVRIWISPYLRAIKGAGPKQQIKKFYMESELLEFQAKFKDHEKWELDYYKGLGSSNEEQVEEDSSNPHFFRIIPDDDAEKSLDLVFDDKFADERKDWILRWNPEESIRVLAELPTEEINEDDNVGEIKDITISESIHHRHIVFSIRDLERSLPSIDGLKESQRKLVFGAQEIWHFMTKKDTNYKKINVSTFGNTTKGRTHYRHGEKSLIETTVKMAQEFVGTNNLPYFTKEGMFGTRDEGGKDASNERYTGIAPEKWLRTVFRKEDIPLLNFIHSEEGDYIEPECYFPIVPIILINGCRGIGTGSSTFSPNHHPEHVVNNIIARLNGEEPEELIPWYKGFNGNIEVEIRKVKSDTEEDEDEELSDEFDIDDDDRDKTKVYKKDTRITLLTEGEFYEENNKIYITELPIGTWTKKYTEWLEKLIESKEIKNFRNEGSIHHPEIIIEGYNRKKKVSIKDLDKSDKSVKEDTNKEAQYVDWEPSVRSLRLVRRYGLTNITILGENKRPIYFRDANELMDYFYKFRYQKYVERKEKQIIIMEEDIKKMKERRAYISAVIGDDPESALEIRNRLKTDIYDDMERLGLAEWTYKAVGGWELNIGAIEKLEKQISDKIAELEAYHKVTIAQIWIPELKEFLKEWKHHFKYYESRQKADVNRLNKRKNRDNKKKKSK